MLACMHYKIIVVGFFEAMGPEQVNFILNQTEMSTLVVAPEYVPKLVKMKKDGLAVHINNLVVMDDKNPTEIEECNQVGLNVTLFQALVEEG